MKWTAIEGIEAPDILTLKSHAMAIKERGIFWHVMVDGVDVTGRCNYAKLGAQVHIFCGDVDRHENWRLDGRVHVSGDADLCYLMTDAPCEFVASPATVTDEECAEFFLEQERPRCV